MSEETKEMWAFYSVTIQIRDRLVGPWPKDPEVADALLKARGLEDLIPPPPDIESMTEEEKGRAKKNALEKSWVGFKSNGAGLYVESRQVKGMLKEAANILKNMVGVKNMKSKLAERVFVEPQEILLGKTEPDGTDKRVVHAMTMQGPRSSIKLYDYLVRPSIAFTLRVLQDGVIAENHLKVLLEYAQENGFGADRSQDFGKFDLVDFSRLN